MARQKPEAVFFEYVAQVVEQARRFVGRTADLAMCVTYFEIGRMIVEKEQGGKARAEYGKGLIVELSAYLNGRFERGFSERTLLNARKFYKIYAPAIPQTMFAELGDGSPNPIRQSMIAELETEQPKRIGQSLSAQFGNGSPKQIPQSMIAESGDKGLMAKSQTLFGELSNCSIIILSSTRAFFETTYPFSPSHVFGKSRMGQHFINRRFQPTVLGLTHDQVPQGRHVATVCAPPKDGEIPSGVFPLAEGAYSRNVPSLRDLVRRCSCRRLKPTVNKVSSLRDWVHYFGKCSKKVESLVTNGGRASPRAARNESPVSGSAGDKGDPRDERALLSPPVSPRNTVGKAESLAVNGVRTFLSAKGRTVKCGQECPHSVKAESPKVQAEEFEENRRIKK